MNKSLVKRFLTKSKDIEKSGAIWNLVASVLVAFQSVILLVIMTHTVGLIPAGIYTMGNTDNNLFLSIGKYGVRPFQVSDVDREYKFREYRMARIISTILMAVVSTGYVLYVAIKNNYSSNKLWIIIWMCIFKLPDSFEDVYYGDYQKNERLDVAAKPLALRMIITIVLWALLLVVTKDLLISVIVSTIVTIILMVWFILLTKEYVTEREKPDSSRVLKLLWVTLPLAVAAFLTLYISAAPKNSIDAHLDDKLQAIYGFIAMPVFVVQLLAQAIFAPVFYKISCYWNDGYIGKYVKESIKQILYIIIITFLCISGAYFLGIPVLSIMYHTELSEYKMDLMFMMIGSGFLGLIVLLTGLLTIMRRQSIILIGYLVVSIVAFFFTSKYVIRYEIRGAVLFFVALLAMLCFIFIIGYIWSAVTQRKKNSNKSLT